MNVGTQNQILALVKQELENIKLKNPAFSLRAFSKKVQIYPSHLSELLAGKRPLSSKAAMKLLPAITSDPYTAHQLLFEVQNLKKQVKEAGPNLLTYGELSMDEIHLLSDWYYFAVHSLSELNSFKSDPEWIAARLGIKLREAKQALTRLEKCGFLVRDKKDNLVSAKIPMATTSQVPNQAIRMGHYQNLRLAERSLDEDEVEIRDFSSISMPTNLKKIKLAKELIQKFRRELCAFLESGSASEKDEVYQMNIQLFPLTKKLKK